MEHATSRYGSVSESVINILQKEYQEGHYLGNCIPGTDANEAILIATESLKADTLLDNLINNQVSFFDLPAKGYCDWSLVAAAEFFLALADDLQDRGEPKLQEEWWALGWATLEKVVLSPTASPLVCYEDLYSDLCQKMAEFNDIKAFDYLKRALAHNLAFNQGDNAENYLRDLADLFFRFNKYDKGIPILTALLQNDPSNIWVYNQIAISFSEFGMIDMGKKATTRALELIASTGDPEELHDQLADALASYNSPQKNKEHRVKPRILADLNAALELDFNTGIRRPISELCYELVPNLDRVPVKKTPKL